MSRRCPAVLSRNFVPFFQGLGRLFVTAWLFLYPEGFVIKAGKGTFTLSKARRKRLYNLISHSWVSVDVEKLVIVKVLVEPAFN